MKIPREQRLFVAQSPNLASNTWVGLVSPKVMVLFVSMKALQKNEKRFLFHLKCSLNFCRGSFGHARKRLDKKTKVNFKVYDLTNWETNNYNTHITQCLKK